MSDIVDLNKRRVELRDEAMFACYPCGFHDGFQIVAISRVGAPVVAGLVCHTCGSVIGVF